MTTAERAELQDLHRESAKMIKADNRAAYAEANDAFHAAIYKGAHNAYLDELTRTARGRVAPFRRAQFDEPGRLAKSHAEHGRVLRAILRADGDAAYAEMRAHISVVRTAVEAVVRPEKPTGHVPNAASELVKD